MHYSRDRLDNKRNKLVYWSWRLILGEELRIYKANEKELIKKSQWWLKCMYHRHLASFTALLLCTRLFLSISISLIYHASTLWKKKTTMKCWEPSLQVVYYVYWHDDFDTVGLGLGLSQLRNISQMLLSGPRPVFSARLFYKAWAICKVQNGTLLSAAARSLFGDPNSRN